MNENTSGDHTETVDIEYDKNKTNYETLLSYFWKWHDPTISQIRQEMSAIFYHDEEQRQLAEKTKREQQQQLARPIVTLITKALPLYEAENCHQKYLLRKHDTVMESLQLSDKDIIQSHTACRLNGYIAGYGKEEDFLGESNNLGITEKVKQYIIHQIREKGNF